MKSKIFNFNNPLESTLYYSAYNFIFCLVFSFICIVLTWFIHSNYFNIGETLREILTEIIFYKFPIFILVLCILMIFAVLTRRSVAGIFLAFVVETAMFSYIVSLMMAAIGHFIIVNNISNGDWVNHLPFSLGYPFYTIIFTLISWSVLWYITLYLRMYLKEQDELKGDSRKDILDILSGAFGKYDD